MSEEQEATDKEYLEDIHDNLHDVIEYCMEAKDNIKDMDNWRIIHDLEFQLGLAFEQLRRYLDKMEIEDD